MLEEGEVGGGKFDIDDFVFERFNKMLELRVLLLLLVLLASKLFAVVVIVEEEEVIVVVVLVVQGGVEEVGGVEEMGVSKEVSREESGLTMGVAGSGGTPSASMLNVLMSSEEGIGKATVEELSSTPIVEYERLGEGGGTGEGVYPGIGSRIWMPVIKKQSSGISSSD